MHISHEIMSECDDEMRGATCLLQKHNKMTLPIVEVANSSTFDFSDTMTSWKSSSEFETSSFLSSATWIDDYCSVCKLEIPSYFISERQEHMDFHVAEMLQQKYSSSDHSMERPKSFQKSKRLHR